MQHNMERNIGAIASQDLHKIEDEIAVVVEKGKGVGHLAAKTLGEMQQLSKERRRGINHTQIMLCLSLMIGDGILLITLLVFVLLLIPYLHLGLRVSAYNLGTSYTKVVWSSFTLIVWSASARIANAYDLLNISNRFRSILNILLVLTVVIFCQVLISPFLTNEVSSYIKMVLFYFILAIPIFCIWRLLFAEIMSLPRFRRRTVIIGATNAGQAIAEEICRAKYPYTTILGYISEETDSQIKGDSVPILGGRSALRQFAQGGLIDMIITAVDYHVCPELFQEVIEMSRLGISVVPMTIAYENTSGKIPVEHIGDQWFLALPLKIAALPLYLCYRKVIDFIIGLFGTATLLLILPFLALLIYLDSPGPIFYSQERLGLMGKPFRIYKFRSMRPDAEQTGLAVWATENDSRITRVGRLMRATHLDEFPQVFNILLGHMSLIGPRPEREEFVINLEKNVPFFRCRLIVKPGLTGWAQVNYHYGGTESDALIKLQYDLYYIKHQSFVLDIFIILKTIVEVFMRKGI